MNAIHVIELLKYLQQLEYALCEVCAFVWQIIAQLVKPAQSLCDHIYTSSLNLHMQNMTSSYGVRCLYEICYIFVFQMRSS